MDTNAINKELIKEYINNSSITDLELKVFLGLYSNYFKLNKNLKNNFEQLNYYEEKIYTIDEVTLKDRERIRIEIDRIVEELKKEKNTEILKYIKVDLEEIEELLSTNNETLNEFINYIKKKIVKMQIMLDLQITFYPSAYELFVSEYSKLEEKKLNR